MQSKRPYRQRSDVFSVTAVARLLGVSYDTLNYHLRRGYVAKPQLGEKRKYYSAADVKRITEYWKSLTQL